jgi:uncharacterized protein RhaS with RHS repeats
MTVHQTLVQRIKTNLDQIIPAWDDYDWWDSLLPEDNNEQLSCPYPNDEIDNLTWDELLEDDLLLRCRGRTN